MQYNVTNITSPETINSEEISALPRDADTSAEETFPADSTTEESGGNNPNGSFDMGDAASALKALVKSEPGASKLKRELRHSHGERKNNIQK